MITINIATFILASKNNDIMLWIFAGLCIISFITLIISLAIETPVFFGIAQRVFLFMVTIWFLYVSIRIGGKIV
jgi:hypothetical protein